MNYTPKLVLMPTHYIAYLGLENFVTAEHEEMIAKRGRGRPPGALNLKTRIKRELFGPQHTASSVVLTPTQILASNMEFFQRRAEECLAEGKDQEATRFKTLANDAAALLAPYVHSKMPTLVAQPDQEAQQYVIRVPDAQPDGQAWSHAVSDVKAITTVNGKARNS